MSILRVFVNSGSQIAIKIASILIGLMVVKILTNEIWVQGYGVYAKVHNYCALFAALADMGLFSLSVKEISHKREDKKYIAKYLSELTGLRIWLGVFFAVLSLILAIGIPGYGNPTMLLYILITQLFVIFGLIFSSYLSYLQADMTSQKASFPALFGRLLALFMIIVVTMLMDISLSSQLLLIFISGLIGNIYMVTMIVRILPDELKIRPKICLDFVIKFLRKNVLYIWAIFFGSIFLRVDVFMVSVFLDGDLGNENVGIYSVAAKVIEIGIFSGVIVMNSFLPFFIKSVHRRTYIVSFVVMMIGGLLFSGLCFWFNEWIIQIISDRSFVSVWAPILGVLGWSVLLHFMGLFFSYLFLSENRYGILFGVYFKVFLVNIWLNYFLIHTHGLIGAAWATFWSQWVFCISLWFLTFYVYRHRIFWVHPKSIQ